MIEEIRIDTLDALKDLVFEQYRNEENGRLRSPYFYRGLPDASYSLVTSLHQNCGDLEKQLERPMLENFIKYARLEYPTINESVWTALMVGQHHGLPTRLMDWSHSTLVALHFACTENNWDDLDKRDGVVWRMDVRDLNQHLPEKYKQALKERRSFMMTVEKLSSITGSLEEYDRDMMGKAMVTLEPPSIDQRIVNQYAFFSLVPMGMTDINQYLEENTEHTIKYIIDKGIRWDLRDMLDQFNTSERTIYPGIDGVTKWIARHYYVRKDPES